MKVNILVTTFFLIGNLYFIYNKLVYLNESLYYKKLHLSDLMKQQNVIFVNQKIIQNV